MSRLLRGWSAILIIIAGIAPAKAEVAPQDRDAIRAVIEGQLEAIRRDDDVKAFSFASPQIQTTFKDPATFMAMVRGGYLPVYRPREVEFRELVELRGQPTQVVLLVGPDNDVVTAYYFMQKQPDGVWRIDGCVLGPARGDRAT